MKGKSLFFLATALAIGTQPAVAQYTGDDICAGGAYMWCAPGAATEGGWTDFWQYSSFEECYQEQYNICNTNRGGGGSGGGGGWTNIDQRGGRCAETRIGC